MTATRQIVLAGGIVLLYVVVGLTVWWILRRRKRRFVPTASEVGHRPEFTARAGFHTAALQASIPFVRVSTYGDFVVIAPPSSTPIVLRRSYRVEIERGRDMLSTTIQIGFGGPGTPTVVKLYPRDVKALESALRQSLDPVSA